MHDIFRLHNIIPFVIENISFAFESIFVKNRIDEIGVNLPSPSYLPHLVGHVSVLMPLVASIDCVRPR